MAENSKIEWTDATWNPITGCSVVSPGCTNCYAMGLAGTRLAHIPSRAGLTVPSKAGPVWNGQVRFNDEQATWPLRWKRPRKIFVCAHGDLFHESVPYAWIDRVFAVMALGPQHTFQVLTKRSARMRAYVTAPDVHTRVWEWAVSIHDRFGQGDHTAFDWPAQHVWLGVSAEDQRRFDERVSDLYNTPAALRFFSFEPLLGQIDARGPLSTGAFRWAIVGGESGRNARPMHPDWARQLRDACAEAGVAFHFKQWGAWSAAIDREQEDSDWRADYSFKLNDRRSDIAWLNLDGGRGFHGERFHVMRRVGKAAAGRLLDGVEHNGMPATLS